MASNRSDLRQATRVIEVSYDFLDLTKMVRTIQRTEGYQDCFSRGTNDCDQADCLVALLPGPICVRE